MSNKEIARFDIFMSETKEQLVRRIENWKIECEIAWKEVESLKKEVEELREIKKELEEEVGNNMYQESMRVFKEAK